jgi:hypothetical protein
MKEVSRTSENTLRDSERTCPPGAPKTAQKLIETSTGRWSEEGNRVLEESTEAVSLTDFQALGSQIESIREGLHPSRT